MPIRTIPGTSTRYGLLCFDANAQERCNDSDGRNGLLSARLTEMASQPDITNIFLFSHGWMGDVPAATTQYDAWMGALMGLEADVERAGHVFPGFRPLLIGLHWPSLPWGDEEIGPGETGDASYSAEGGAGGSGLDPEVLRRVWEERLGDAPEVRAPLGIIFDEAVRNSVPDQLSGQVRQAYLDLHSALGLAGDGLASDGLAAAPDTDGLDFDPDAALHPGSLNGGDDGEQPDFGTGSGGVFQGMLGILRLLSYWTMKKRARTIGEQGMHTFVKALQRATAQRRTPIHLMGHSFGTIVVSSVLGGPGCTGPLERPINSVFLAQGAVSLWSYAESIPWGAGGPGYFSRVVTDGKFRGPLVTTQSTKDLAVGKQYPKSCLPGEISFGEQEGPPMGPPMYGAVGAFGFHGLPEATRTDPDARMLPAGAEYGFEPGRIYNLESSEYIRNGPPPSGAHSDIAGPEVAHAIWQAAFASA